MTALLDGPVLAALTIAEHEHHERAGRWLATQASFALTPATEAALLRFLLRLGESPAAALAVLEGLRRHPHCEFWASDLSHTELAAADLESADGLAADYLAALATRHHGQLATLDPALAQRLGTRAVLIAG